MKLKKYISIILSLTLFCSCSNELATSNDTVITIGYDVDKNTIDLHIKNFEKDHPGVKIVPVDWQYDSNNFETMVANNTLPGVFTTSFTETKWLIDKSYVADITQDLREFGLLNRINDYMLEMISRNGKAYFVPRNIYSMGLYQNPLLFKEAGLVNDSNIPIIPDNFEDLRTVAKEIKDKTGKPGFAFPSENKFGGWYFTLLAWNYGVTFMQKVDDKWKATFNTPECVSALEYIKAMKWTDNSLPETTSIRNETLMEMVANNEVGMTFAEAIQLDEAVRINNLEPSNICFSKMPKGRAGRVSMIGGSYYAINPNYTPEQRKLAFEWLVYDKQYNDVSQDDKKTIEENYKNIVDNNLGIIGLTGMKLWNDYAANSEFENNLINKYCNVNLNYVDSFNNSSDVEYRLEEPVCAQDLYQILDKCISAVLEDKNADCASLIAKANEEFQQNYLNYEK